MTTGLAGTFPFHGQLTEAGRQVLGAFPLCRVPGPRPLLARGDPAGGAYLVVGGALRVFYLTPEGREATLYRVEPGGTCILALTATMNEEPYPAWVESGPRGAAFVRIPDQAVRRLLDSEAAFRAFAFRALSGRVFELMRVLEEAGTARVEQRLARFLLGGCDERGAVAATQERIAAELGTAREVVFRSLRSLSTRGLVKTGRGRVVLVDPAGLEAVARTGGP